VTSILIAIHVLVSLALIMIVLLQTGKGASLGAAFGGASQTVFGSRGPTSFLGKLTTGAAIVFMLTSLSLAYLSSRRSSSTIMTDQPRQEIPAPPAQPEQPPAEKPAPTPPAGPQPGS
jgi:preprotein translocase subunit SecG